MEIIEIEEGKKYHTPIGIGLGNFDGIHCGHQKLFQHLIEKAKTLELKSSVLMFRQHTKKKLNNEKFEILTDLEDKMEILRTLNIQQAYIIDFSEQFMRQSPEEFLDFLYEKLNVRLIVVGEDYRFGAKAKGDIHQIQKYAEDKDLAIEILDKVKWGSQEISSSLIREYLKEGQLDTVEQLLGRPYQMKGKIIHGEKRGRTLGIPTANTSTDISYIIPKKGVYFTKIIVEDMERYALTCIGENKTFQGKELKIETYIYDFQGNIYDRIMSIQFLKYLRENYKFENVEELIFQMNYDREQGRRLIEEIEKKKSIL